jgi:hypothetical protein
MSFLANAVLLVFIVVVFATASLARSQHNWRWILQPSPVLTLFINLPRRRITSCLPPDPNRAEQAARLSGYQLQVSLSFSPFDVLSPACSLCFPRLAAWRGQARRPGAGARELGVRGSRRGAATSPGQPARASAHSATSSPPNPC